MSPTIVAVLQRIPAAARPILLLAAILWLLPSIANRHPTTTTPIATSSFVTFPGLPLDDVCEQTLKRIHQEYWPIIQRRGDQVLSISEMYVMCCCADRWFGPCTPSKLRKRQLQKQSNNVWGYNPYDSLALDDPKQQHTIHSFTTPRSAESRPALALGRSGGRAP
jgi:hypothetical protein